jgi:hypothetical protein
MDGRTYKRSEPKPRQRPFADDYRDRVEKMQNGVMNLYDLHKDDRFNKNREAVRAYAGYLVACARDLCDLLDDLGIDYNLYGGPVRMTTEEAAAALDDLSNSGAR